MDEVIRMTDEEKAENWIKDHSGLIGSYKFVKYDYDSLKQAFLAGLKINVKEFSTETLLKELINRKVIRSWYYNGTYHVGNELSKG